MPASSEFTLIKLFRSTNDFIEDLRPESAEPLYNLSNGHLGIGDGITAGGRGLTMDGGDLDLLSDEEVECFYVTYLDAGETDITLPFEYNVQDPKLIIFLNSLKVPLSEIILTSKTSFKFKTGVIMNKARVEVTLSQYQNSYEYILNNGDSVVILPFDYNVDEPKLVVFLEGCKVPNKELNFVTKNQIAFNEPLQGNNLRVEVLSYE